MTEPYTATLELPTLHKAQEGLQEQISRLAPIGLNGFGKLASTAFFEYWRDFAQRSILFVDVLRRRGNQYRGDAGAHHQFGSDL